MFLWQGRFKSQPVEKNLYLFNCGRYIEQNPVKAKIGLYAQDYPHSSAKYYTNGIKDSIITENPLYKELGNDRKQQQKQYKEFLLDFDLKDLTLYNADKPVGSKEFQARLVNEKGHYIPKRQGR